MATETTSIDLAPTLRVSQRTDGSESFFHPDCQLTQRNGSGGDTLNHPSGHGSVNMITSRLDPSEAVDLSEQHATQQCGPLVPIGQGMIAGHRLNQHRQLRGELRILLEITESCGRGCEGGPRKRLVRDGSDGDQVKIQGDGRRSMKVP